MSCPSTCVLGENLTFTVQAKAASGAPVAATGAVSYSVYEDETATAIATGTMTQLSGQTGFYSEQIGCTSANGYERFKTYNIRITATVAAVAVAVVYTVICLGREDTLTATSGALTSTANYKTYAGITHTNDDTLIGYLVSRATSAIESYCDRTFASDTYLERYDGDGTSELYVNQYPITDVLLLSTTLQDVMYINNTSSDAYMAVVKVVSNDTDASVAETLTLTVSGGANAGANSLTLSSYTVTELVAAINALGSGWVATATDSTFGMWESVELLPCSGLNCLDNHYVYLQTPYTPVSTFKIQGMTQTPYRGNNGRIWLSEGYAQGIQNITVRYTAGYATTPADLEQICIDLVNVYYRGRKKDMTVKSERLGDHSITMAEGSRDLPASIAKSLAPYKRWRV